MAELIVVQAGECLELREQLLHDRPSGRYPHDDEPRALHVAAKERDQVLGVASLLPEGHPRDGRQAWRLRGLVVRPEVRGLGLGRMLLAAIQAVARQRGGGLWCAAPVTEQGFFQRFGFAAEGEPFVGDAGLERQLMTWDPPERRRARAPKDGPGPS
jgi:GNAT superfamily N-acetyltransferase